MKILKKLFIYIFCLTTVFCVVGCDSEWDEDVKKGFRGDSISVVLTNDVSLQIAEELFEITVNYFPELNLSEIINNSIHLYEGKICCYPFEDKQQFRISLNLKLGERNHQMILEYVEILNARKDVYGASPNYISKNQKVQVNK